MEIIFDEEVIETEDFTIALILINYWSQWAKEQHHHQTSFSLLFLNERGKFSPINQTLLMCWWLFNDRDRMFFDYKGFLFHAYFFFLSNV
jgi:hypothetical protein